MYFPSSNTPSHKLARVSKSRVPGKTSFYSFNLLWLVWAVGGGLFITKFLLCNWLAILVKPVFEEPVDTVQVDSEKSVIPIYCMFQYWQDVHELGLVPYKDPGWYIWKQKMEQMAPPYPALAERMVIATSWEEFHNITEFKLLAKDRITNFQTFTSSINSILNSGYSLEHLVCREPSQS